MITRIVPHDLGARSIGPAVLVVALAFIAACSSPRRTIAERSAEMTATASPEAPKPDQPEASPPAREVEAPTVAARTRASKPDPVKPKARTPRRKPAPKRPGKTILVDYFRGTSVASGPDGKARSEVEVAMKRAWLPDERRIIQNTVAFDESAGFRRTTRVEMKVDGKGRVEVTNAAGSRDVRGKVTGPAGRWERLETEGQLIDGSRIVTIDRLEGNALETRQTAFRPGGARLYSVDSKLSRIRADEYETLISRVLPKPVKLPRSEPETKPVSTPIRETARVDVAQNREAVAPETGKTVEFFTGSSKTEGSAAGEASVVLVRREFDRAAGTLTLTHLEFAPGAKYPVSTGLVMTIKGDRCTARSVAGKLSGGGAFSGTPGAGHTWELKLRKPEGDGFDFQGAIEGGRMTSRRTARDGKGKAAEVAVDELNRCPESHWRLALARRLKEGRK